MQELAEHYHNAMTSKSESFVESDNAQSPPSLLSPITSPMVEEPDSIQLVSPSFTRIGEVKFDPQLKVTGDATPLELIEWLGVNKEKVPEIFYVLSPSLA